MQVVRLRSHGRLREPQLGGISETGIGAPHRGRCATPGDEGASDDDAQGGIARGPTDRRHRLAQGERMDFAGEGETEDIVPAVGEVREKRCQGIGGRSADDRGRPARIAEVPGHGAEAEGVGLSWRRSEKNTALGLPNPMLDLRSDRLSQEGLEPSHRLGDLEEVTEILLPHHAEILRHRHQYLPGQDVPWGAADRVPGDFRLKSARIVEQKPRQFVNIPRGGLDMRAMDIAKFRKDLSLDEAR